MIYINDKEVNFIYNLGTKVKEVFSYGTKIWPKQVLFDYMFFKLADGYESGNVSYKFDEYYNLHNKYLKISTDGNNWQDWNEAISMTPNVKYYVKGEDDYVRNSYAGALEFFTSDVSAQNFNIECGGNIMSLVNLNENITATGCFSGLFYNMRNLVTAPKLPYLSVPAYGYAVMFNNTKILTAAPELPATTIGENAYRSMFYSSGINTAPNVLPSTTLAPYCYLSMFADCKNLTVAPELPATTLADHCYDGMFKLSGITEAPALPATTLANDCYNSMFQNCTSLNKAPVLTATTLANNCYRNMFYGCSGLTEITLNGDFNSSYATNWVRNVSTSGTFYNNSDLDIPVGVNGIPTGWKEIRPVKADYMYFKLQDGETSGNVSYQFNEYYNLHNKYLKYSTDGSNWTDWTEQISMSPNVKYYVKGEDDYVRNSFENVGFFSSDVTASKFNIECGGNVMSLVNLNENITTNYCFFRLFYEMTNLLTPPELPATTLADSCYYYMFAICSSLTQAPELPATTLAESCYSNMFFRCYSLTQAPELPATTLADSCYISMFVSCSSLTQAPELPATTLASYCYNGMFYGCSSLTQAPELPATTLASYCYSGMFENCTSLTQAPALPVTTLTDSCYYVMFRDCTSLTQAPELPATTLATNCYGFMFDGCSSLTQAPALPATTLANECYSYMFNGCTSLTEITLNGDFNSSYATNWVSNVSPSGTFYNNSDVDIPFGVNGIPEGWTDIRPVKSYYMYFKLADGAESGNVSYQFDEYYNLHNKYLKISTDVNNWSDWTEQISMAPNVKYYVKGEDDYVRNSNISSGFFSSDVSQNQFNIECGGNIMSLVNINKNITTNYCFFRLFFKMKNLLTPPKLPATTLANSCYNTMFGNCTSLIKAPKLPATKLENSCYYWMFYGCSSLTEAPELPATRLTISCYYGMFNNANKLNWIKALFTNTPNMMNTNGWVKGVSAQGVFVKSIEASWTTTGVNAVPTGWTVIYYDQREDKYFKTNHREEECDKYGNPLR